MTTTPTPLTAGQLSALGSIFSNTSLTQSQQVTTYYQTLASYGYPYGNLALGVVNNSTLAGQIANNFIQDYATAHGIPYNSTIASNIQYALAFADYTARNAPTQNGADLTGQQIEAYHQEVFGQVDPGLPIQAWTGYVPYALLGEIGSQEELSGTLGQSLVAAEVFNLTTTPLYWLTNTSNAQMGVQWLGSIEQAVLQTPTFQQALTNIVPPIIYDAPNVSAANAAIAASLLSDADEALMNYASMSPTATTSPLFWQISPIKRMAMSITSAAAIQMRGNWRMKSIS